MKAKLAVSIALLLAACFFDLKAQGQGTNSVSDVLREFLSREGVRDSETGAILSVRPMRPRFSENPPLDCSIRKLPVTNQVSQYEVMLTTRWMTGTEVHERIVLDAEPALLAEVSRQAKHAELASERERRKREARSKRIVELTNGLLSYGMNKEQVIGAKGGKWKYGGPNQKAGLIEMHYEDITLMLDPVLVDAWLPGLAPENKQPTPIPLNRFEERAKP